VTYTCGSFSTGIKALKNIKDHTEISALGQDGPARFVGAFHSLMVNGIIKVNHSSPVQKFYKAQAVPTSHEG
jgi:hypothetical protein